MNSRILDESVAGTETGFWRRQFARNITPPQIAFDVGVGMVLPILCLVFDPIVFRSGGFGAGILKDYQLFAYAVIILEVLALGVWFLWAGRAGAWCVALAGILVAGSLFSFVVACAILPLSLLGLFMIIGVLGFTPFLTAFVFLRNGWRALKVGNEGAGRAELLGSLVLGALLVLGGPAVAWLEVSHIISESVPELTGDDPQRAAAAAHRLMYVSWIIDVDLDDLVWAYQRSTDEASRERLARTYKEITGQEIETRLSILMD